MYNGRVNIMGKNNADRFLLYEPKQPTRSTNYSNALIGNFQVSNLSNAFFLLKILIFYTMLLSVVYLENQMVDLK